MAQETSFDVPRAFFPFALPPPRCSVVSRSSIVALSFRLAWWWRCRCLAVLKWHRSHPASSCSRRWFSVLWWQPSSCGDGGRSDSERACEDVRPRLILHVKLKFRVCRVCIDLTCDLLHEGRLE